MTISLQRTTDNLTEAEIFDAHEGGKLSIGSTRPLRDMRDLSLAYTPGVAKVCEAIAEDPEVARTHTGIGNTVAVISDGTAVLGLGDIGPQASLPVMEGKAQLFSSFAGLKAVPIVLDVHEVDELVETIAAIAPSFGAINLEDISAPRCFEVERRLIERLDIPVMHDDQHGTAVVILAALRNSLKLLDRKIEDLKIVISGAGAAGVAAVDILTNAGATDIVVLDSRGIIEASRGDLSPVKADLAAKTNPRSITGGMNEAFTGADLFIGVSGGNIGEEALKLMAPAPILFTLANPTPEIDPELSNKYGAIVATGRSDLPNQINNVLAFPGIFAGALAAKAKKITPEMKLAAAEAIAAITEDDLEVGRIVPTALDPRVAPAVKAAVQAVAEQQGV
ncbi:NAD-dependent malic enzyme [Corynebacterium deserti GIMN1.010]|uniref:NAD-dependent malic enzyme n=1 Tax=Corynebacterium deserti GIMN1.010 TaxID=931089 RepID=A0A0M3QAC3_9CORY|nr:NADP-dependent malic enzyme [Corynebacterium deserti]ALC07053.1 NAD-dependent malic enzyme [Corynebacterium deserti GIMN1.010]